MIIVVGEVEEVISSLSGYLEEHLPCLLDGVAFVSSAEYP